MLCGTSEEIIKTILNCALKLANSNISSVPLVVGFHANGFDSLVTFL